MSVEIKLSEAGNVTRGVPHGAVLGPLLFLILIGDIRKNLEQFVATSFADDIRIWRPIESRDDTTLLQEDLTRITAWVELV